jgi:hypothetical protein
MLPVNRRSFLGALGAAVVLPPLFWADEAHAKATIAQLGAKIDDGRRWSFDFRWRDIHDKRQRAEFFVKDRIIRQDLRTPKRISIEEVNREVAALINRQPPQKFGAKVTATVDGRSMRLQTQAANPAQIQASLKKASNFQRQAMKDAFEARGYLLTPGNLVLPDHCRHVSDYALTMKPVVQGLGGPRKRPRAFARHALGFVQSIPYELRALQQDRYRRPFAVLAKNKGDCDSKVVLYLAMLRHAWPKLRTAVVYVPGHAFCALDLRPKAGEVGVDIRGRSWLAIEPVGPMLADLGQLAPSSREGLRDGYQARIVPLRKRAQA